MQIINPYIEATKKFETNSLSSHIMWHPNRLPINGISIVIASNGAYQKSLSFTP